MATWHARSGFSVWMWYRTCFWPKRRVLCWTMMKDHWPTLIQPCLRSFLRWLVSADNWNNAGPIGHLLQGVNQRLPASWEYEALDLRLRFPIAPAWHRFWKILDSSPRHFERTRVVPTLRHSCVGPSPTDRDLPSASKDRRIFARKRFGGHGFTLSHHTGKMMKAPKITRLELKNLFRRVTAMWKGWRQSRGNFDPKEVILLHITSRP